MWLIAIVTEDHSLLEEREERERRKRTKTKMWNRHWMTPHLQNRLWCGCTNRVWSGKWYTRSSLNRSEWCIKKILIKRKWWLSIEHKKIQLNDQNCVLSGVTPRRQVTSTWIHWNCLGIYECFLIFDSQLLLSFELHSWFLKHFVAHDFQKEKQTNKQMWYHKISQKHKSSYMLWAKQLFSIPPQLRSLKSPFSPFQVLMYIYTPQKDVWTNLPQEYELRECTPHSWVCSMVNY